MLRLSKILLIVFVGLQGLFYALNNIVNFEAEVEQAAREEHSVVEGLPEQEVPVAPNEVVLCGVVEHVGPLCQISRIVERVGSGQESGIPALSIAEQQARTDVLEQQPASNRPR